MSKSEPAKVYANLSEHIQAYAMVLTDHARQLHQMATHSHNTKQYAQSKHQTAMAYRLGSIADRLREITQEHKATE